ncbi:MAG: hypothetical protein ACOCXJ_09010 [Planctomycetota bacterium]
MNMQAPLQEDDRIASRLVAIVGGITVLVAVLSGLWAWMVRPQHEEQVVRDDRQVLQYRFADPGQPAIEQRERLHALLDSHGWIDEEAGIVHVPVEAAMEIYLERQGAQP